MHVRHGRAPKRYYPAQPRHPRTCVTRKTFIHSCRLRKSHSMQFRILRASQSPRLSTPEFVNRLSHRFWPRKQSPKPTLESLDKNPRFRLHSRVARRSSASHIGSPVPPSTPSKLRRHSKITYGPQRCPSSGYRELAGCVRAHAPLRGAPAPSQTADPQRPTASFGSLAPPATVSPPA